MTVIRPATSNDARTIARLIGELATYEGLADQATPSEEALWRNLRSGANPGIFAFIAENMKDHEGFILCYPRFSTFLCAWYGHVEDLFVRQTYRGNNIGGMLLQKAAAECRARGWTRLDLEVLSWNRVAIGFYEKLGGRIRDDWKLVRFEDDALQALAA